MNERLEQINIAISAIENGAQEYRIGSRTVKKADLSILYSERERLELLEERRNNGTVSVAVFDKR